MIDIRKSSDLRILLSGSKRLGTAPSKQYRLRSESIEGAGRMLRAGHFDVEMFLDEITLRDKEGIDLNWEIPEEMLDDESACEPSCESANNICMACGIHPRTVVMLPCRDLTLCKLCLINTSTETCQKCGKSVDGTFTFN